MAAAAAAHVFVDDVAAPAVDDVDRHHLERVLRLRPGEIVTVADGSGAVRPCTFVGGEAVLEPAGEVATVARPAPALAVGFALVKGDRPEWIVQKLTECGIDRIIPFRAARSVVRWDEAKADRALARLQRVAREAAMQSRQAFMPVVEPPVALADLVAGGGVVRADRGGTPITLRTPCVLVGPEGGWADEEREAVPDAVALGPSVLRAETAAVAAGVLLAALRSGVVAPRIDA